MSFQFYTPYIPLSFNEILITFLIMYYTTIFMFCILKKKVKYINFKEIKKLNKKKNNIILNLHKKIILNQEINFNQEINLINYKINQEINLINYKINQEINLINYKINQEINNINKKKLITTS